MKNSEVDLKGPPWNLSWGARVLQKSLSWVRIVCYARRVGNWILLWTICLYCCCQDLPSHASVVWMSSVSSCATSGSSWMWGGPRIGDIGLAPQPPFALGLCDPHQYIPFSLSKDEPFGALVHKPKIGLFRSTELSFCTLLAPSSNLATSDREQLVWWCSAHNASCGW